MKIIDNSGIPSRNIGKLIFSEECECNIPAEQVTRDLVTHIVGLQKRYNIEIDGEIEIGDVDEPVDAEDILTASTPGSESADDDDVDEDEDEDEDK